MNTSSAGGRNVDSVTSVAQFRGAMPVANRWAYFDHAAVSPLPRPTQVAIGRWLEEATQDGDIQWPRWSQQLDRTRSLAAQMLHASPNEIALVPNTTTGISIIAQGLPWKEGDNVVTLANEFPSNIYPWMNLERRGVELRRVAVSQGIPNVSAVRAACDDRTRLVALSWVGYASGWRWNIAEAVDLAHRCGALLMLDAIQGLGVHPIDVEESGVDFLAADGHKWLPGPEGAGILYIRSQHLELLTPQLIGWNSMVHRYDFDRIEWDLRDSASRFEGGTYNMSSCLGLGASLQLLLDLGLTSTASSIEKWVLQFRQQAVNCLRERGAKVLNDIAPPEHQSGILCFQMPGFEPERIRQVFRELGVVVSCRGGGIRLSPHGYADDEDLAKLDSALSTL